jgi:hypothetical protein
LFAATLTSDSLTATPGGSDQKARFMEAAKKIRKALNVTVPFSAPLSCLLLGFLIGSCGVKTNILSDLTEPRPAIPFKEQPSKNAFENSAQPKSIISKDKK